MSEKSPFDNRGLGLLVIVSSDMARSVEFYQALGLSFERHSHPPCGDHFASTRGHCVFEICQSHEGRPVTSPLTFGFNVSRVDQAVEIATAHGGLLKRKPQFAPWGRSATVTDPDGHSVLLMEPPENVSGVS